MKRLFTLVALTLVAAVSISVSAQSSKIVGKWNSSAGSQTAMLDAMGADIEKSVSTTTFNSDGTYVTYTYTKANVNTMGIGMYMFIEANDIGTWKYSDNSISMVSKGLELINFDIKFDNPEMNAMIGDIKTSMKEMMNQGVGLEVVYVIESMTDNQIEMSLPNEYLPIDFTLTRIK